jgi:hypothetical protein
MHNLRQQFQTFHHRQLIHGCTPRPNKSEGNNTKHALFMPSIANAWDELKKDGNNSSEKTHLDDAPFSWDSMLTQCMMFCGGSGSSGSGSGMQHLPSPGRATSADQRPARATEKRFQILHGFIHRLMTCSYMMWLFVSEF